MDNPNKLELYTDCESEFAKKAFDLLGITYSYEYKVNLKGFHTHNYEFKCETSEQSKLFSRLMAYNYYKNIL